MTREARMMSGITHFCMRYFNAHPASQRTEYTLRCPTKKARDEGGRDELSETLSAPKFNSRIWRHGRRDGTGLAPISCRICSRTEKKGRR